MTAAATKAVAVKIDFDICERIKRLAESRHRTSHWIMREAINQYVEREEKREAFRQEGMQAWHAYQENGLHATLDETDAWLANLAAGNDVEPPECHV